MDDLTGWLPIITLGGSIVFFYLTIIVWLIFLFSAETGENGWLATIATLVVISLFNILNTSFDMWEFVTWANVGIYLMNGVLYAIIKVFIYGKKARKKIEDSRFSSGEEYFKANNREALMIRDYKIGLKGHVFRWWFLWPISLLSWLGQDLIKDLWNWIYTQVKSLFERIFELGLK